MFSPIHLCWVFFFSPFLRTAPSDQLGQAAKFLPSLPLPWCNTIKISTSELQKPIDSCAPREISHASAALVLHVAASIWGYAPHYQRQILLFSSYEQVVLLSDITSQLVFTCPQTHLISESFVICASPDLFELYAREDKNESKLTAWSSPG